MQSLRFFYSAVCVFCLQYSLPAQGFDRIDPLRFTKENMHFLNDANGRPFKPLRNFDEEGSPYFSDTYIESRIQMVNGKVYHNVPIKFNQLTGEIIFKTAEGAEMMLVTPFQRIELQHNGKTYVFRSGFPPIDKQHEQSLYQVLDSGTTLLLKYTTVTYQDNQPYNLPTITRTYTKKENHYIWKHPRGLLRLPKNESDWFSFFGEHKTEMSNFIMNSHLKLKNEEDLIKAVKYYNQLLQQVSASRQ